MDENDLQTNIIILQTNINKSKLTVYLKNITLEQSKLGQPRPNFNSHLK